MTETTSSDTSMHRRPPGRHRGGYIYIYILYIYYAHIYIYIYTRSSVVESVGWLARQSEKQFLLQRMISGLGSGLEI